MNASVLLAIVSASGLLLLGGCSSEPEGSATDGASSELSEEVTTDPTDGAPDSSVDAADENEAVTIEAVLESRTGTRLRVSIVIAAPLPGDQALDTPSGAQLQAGCSDPNLRFNLDNPSTQVVPITWQAVDETEGGFAWDPLTESTTGIVLTGGIPLTATDSFAKAPQGCLPFSTDIAMAMVRVPESRTPAYTDVYTPNNPRGGFDWSEFHVGVEGRKVAECEVNIDDDEAFATRLERCRHPRPVLRVHR